MNSGSVNATLNSKTRLGGAFGNSRRAFISRLDALSKIGRPLVDGRRTALKLFPTFPGEFYGRSQEQRTFRICPGHFTAVGLAVEILSVYLALPQQAH
jgi:hypothetical protein